jgi:hypothetical protein
MPCSRWLLFAALACATAAAQEGGQPEKDPHRPPCNSVRCHKIKEFLKSHYCGESPAGNGPDDGCEIRSPRKRELAAKVTADYRCEWIQRESKSKCWQSTLPTPEIRGMLTRELQRSGLPDRAEKAVNFTIIQSPVSGWLLTEATYSRVAGTDLRLCEVVALIRGENLQVLRRVKYQKTDADVPDVTTWYPIDVSDVDGDGQPEVVLGGDSYEDHWFEVVSVQNDSFKTIFSGLGYYL